VLELTVKLNYQESWELRILGYQAVRIGHFLPTFPEHLSVPYSTVKVLYLPLHPRVMAQKRAVFIYFVAEFWNFLPNGLYIKRRQTEYLQDQVMRMKSWTLTNILLL